MNNKQLFVPIITPMHQGSFDGDAYKELMQSLEHYIDGYVPCLSSGEGHTMNIALWKQVLIETLKNTKKPVYVGIKRKTKQEVLEMLDLAKELGATGVTIPVLCDSEDDIYSYLQEISSYSSLPIIIYNTEKIHIDDVEVLKKLDTSGKIIAIKDSSGNKEFFTQMIEAKTRGELSMKILQGMENELHTSLDGNGFLIALANVEPALCREYMTTGDEGLGKKIQSLRAKYNLGGNRYITLKAILMMQGVITSAEEVDAMPF